MSKPTSNLPPSTSSSTERSAAATELGPLIQELKATCDNCDKQTFASQQFHTATESLLRLRHTFLDNDRPREAQEAFRHLNGFETLLQLAKKLSHMYEPTELSAEERRSLLTLYKDALAVLAESLKGNFGNKRYFAKRISGGGTAALQEALDIIVPKFNSAQSDTEQFYGGILAAALCQEAVADIFTTLKAKFQSVKVLLQQDVKAEVDRRIGSSETVEVPELLGPFLKGWLKQSASSPSDYRVQRLVLPACLCQLAHQSQRNLTTLHATGILSSILPILFGSDRLESERTVYQDLAQLLCAQGLTSLEDAATLYRQAHGCARMLRFLVDIIKCSKEPPLIQFDMSLHGYSSLEFSTLGRPFPPVTSSGYTIAVWARFDTFDPSTHTTIFGAFDASQSCFLLAYLERDTRNFILQTSIRGTRPSVRFKSMAFEPNRWYHICVVHKKPRPPSHSRASLFIDGEFVEQLRIDYPCVPVSNTPNRLPRVQAFFGTPQDLAMKLGKAVSVSRWSLANALLFEEAHSDDMVAVFYNLGPRYFGNFQDCLGSFQTYKASATLNLRNEHLHPGKEEESDIVTAIRRKASVLIREGSILINISPMSVLDDDDNNNIDESQLIKSLSRKAIKNLHLLTKAGGNAVAANGAIPSLNDALTQAHGMGVLTGDPVVSVPHSLDDVSWRIGGCAAVHLSLVHAAKTKECLTLAVEALYEAVQDNWRNSEAMERENGYGILAAILRDKFGLGNSSATSRASSICSNLEERFALGLDLLRLTLKFVGYDFEHPNRSIITNPLAYRVLLVDLDIWRLGDSAQLSLYYSQFSTFAGESNYRRFNAKRLSRMRVNKRLLEALKGDEFTSESLRLLISAFRSLMESCLSADLLRSLALFITYAIHKTREPSRLQKKKSLRFTAGSQQIAASAERGDYVSSTKIAVEMLRMYSSVLCDSHDLTPLKKFARSVTNKWLLYLICEDEPEIVALATKILARLIVSHGDVYSKRFSEKTGGYVIMRHRLRSWWKVPAIWCICLGILFGLDGGDMRLDQPFNRPGLIQILSSNGQPRVAFPEILPVLMEMMQLALQSVISADELSYSGVHGTKSPRESPVRLESPLASLTTRVTELTKQISLLDAVVGLFADLHQKSADFRDFAAQSDYVQWLLYVTFPVVAGSNISSTDFELKSRAAKSNSHDHTLPVRPRSSGIAGLHTTTVEGSSSRDRQAGPLRRGSSFILVSSDRTKFSPSFARIHKAFIPLGPPPDMSATNHPLVQAILSLVLSVFCDQLLERKDFAGLGLYLKTPTSSLEQQAYFNSWILRNFLSRLRDVAISKPQVILEPRALSNMGRFATHIGEAVYEGWFIDGATHTLEFAGTILEYLQQSNVSSLKSVRLCSQAVTTIRATLFRVVLLKLSEVGDREACEFLNRLSYWQVVLLFDGEVPSDYLRLLCYLLYTKLISQDWDTRLAAAGLWRVILVQKPAEMSAILSQAAIPLQKRLSDGFEVLVGMEDKAFLQWVDGHQDDLNAMFLGLLSRSWETFVQEESSNIDSSTRARASKRQEKLRHWNQLERLSEEVTRKHETTFPHWVSNISASEFLKHQRALQDQQDNSLFMWTAFSHMTLDLKRFGGVLAEDKDRKWRLDQTEGRSRMRLRMVPDESGERQDYQPKRKASEPPAIKIDTQVQPSSSGNTTGLTPTVLAPENMDDNQQDAHSDSRSVLEESFEMIDDPKADLEDYEDKNRKVMRSLHRGDQVENVCNMSRIIGLEACEGLLILGKDHIYILDNFFQRSDGEIVNVWQAPPDERDPYVRMIAGRESFERRTHEHETRSWKWSDLVSVSKRRFLFRDVALEVFFTDGTSYLLTLISSRARDNLCSQLASKAPQVTGSAGHSRPEDVWRFETLRSQEDAPQSLGSKFASVFGHSPVHPATRKWIKGEISNFHYLMLINTLAGRTFNDLTQYPVFPWVLADYTSEELDLTDPQAFRDLSKPMGCQTMEREAEFRERYKAFAEMGDGDSPPFHYGTHYSSAMIVCSYLIRLQPFVKSYLLLQGGTFDHADRLFYSIGKAWESASRGNMSDVRELTPEFFYLPEFLVNSNKYDFGLLQNMTTAIDSVELPPWAKGDPKIFIAKHREALESPYVSENLHHWIDLVFGCKQKGEAAIEAVNVFHHLSYQGAKDIDNIDDPVERLATIGIIHNFGQTPHQIFTRPHPPREDTRHKVPRLDRLAESLTQLPLSLLDIGEQVSTLSMKHDRLLCAAPLRLNIPPNYDKYMEWGFFDGSVRFYSADSRKILGHFEHLHIGQLSCTIFADSRTLVTSGTDCVVSIWTYNSTAKSVDLQPAGSLFGHRTPVNVLAVSRSFSALLSASTDGQIMLWDLNQHTFVRELPASGLVDCARINDVTGEIMVCRGNRISIYTLNGALLLDQDVCESIDDRVMSCVCYEGADNEWQERELIFTGHRKGVVNIWNKIIRDGRFELELIRQLHHIDNNRDNGANISAGISCILALPHVVYTGDEAGRVPVRVELRSAPLKIFAESQGALYKFAVLLEHVEQQMSG